MRSLSGTHPTGQYSGRIAAKADVLVTGDRDFLESSIKTPKIVTAAEFLQME